MRSMRAVGTQGRQSAHEIFGSARLKYLLFGVTLPKMTPTTPVAIRIIQSRAYDPMTFKLAPLLILLAEATNWLPAMSGNAAAA